jgi:hypothetical protein
MTSLRLRLALGLLVVPAAVACAPAPATPTAAPSASGPPAWTIGDASFVSFQEDKVGPNGHVAASSKPDLKARLVLSSTKPVTIRSIDIVQQGQNIPPVSYPVQWSTSNASRWVLGAFDSNGKPLNTSHTPSLTTLNGTLNLDLYGEGMGPDGIPLAANSTKFEVQVTDGDGNTQAKTFMAM